MYSYTRQGEWGQALGGGAIGLVGTAGSMLDVSSWSSTKGKAQKARSI
jgi:hypothetical protein